ncbi:MAG TPA: alpha/beta hydrolase [Anaerolineae bacterium]|nr:alpha/beta hydrolase [Anaerolineae bacterium]HOQ97507.1 alpha/beta hydrolase [Anaerolineae bacterium]HPL28879.1 alpha/beta hydrolase [Anaerolineae bacterium]
MPHATIRGYQMYYEDHGQGEPLVFLHGGMATSADFAALIPTFAERYRVLANDRWGYGRSSRRDGFAQGYLWQDTADTAAWLDGLNVGRVHVVGHSDGGSAGLLLAVTRPDLVRSLVAVAAHTHSEPRTIAGLQHLQRLVRTSPGYRAALERHLGPGGAAMAEVWYAHWLDPTRITLDIRAEVSRVRCPTLVIQGEGDEFATPAHAEGIANAIPGAELWLIPNCRHTPHHECRQAFSERVLAFLARAQ